MRWPLAGVVCCGLLMLLPPHARAQTDAAGALTLDPRIGVAQPAQFDAVCGEDEWRNPLVDVSDDGIRVRSLSIPTPRTVPLARLERTLAELPVSDWPYGRIVAIPGQAHLAAHHPDAADQLTDARHQIVRLHVGWWTYPHACGARETRTSARLR